MLSTYFFICVLVSLAPEITNRNNTILADIDNPFKRETQ